MSAAPKSRSRWMVAYVAAFVLFLYVPILLLPIFSFNNAATTSFPLRGFTSKWYVSLIDNPAILDAARNSFFVGISVAILSTVLGICAARAVTRYKFRGQRPALGLIMAPLFLPEIIVAVSLLLIILQAGIELSLITVIIGQTMFCIPYAMSVLMSGFDGFDRSLEEASLDLGETAFGTFRRVTLPVVAPAIISSLLVCFTISLDEFILAFFLAGDQITLPLYIWGELRFPAKLPVVLALGTIILIASILLLTLAELFRRRAEKIVTSTGVPHA
jgi:spermidine/putrescine transport system permease protein